MSALSRSSLFISIAMIAIAGCSGTVAVDGSGEEGVSEERASEGKASGVAAPAEPSQKASELAEGADTTDSESESFGPSLCDHDVCTTGTPLTLGCDLCVDHICEVASFCCTGEWDATCVYLAGTICGQQCPAACGDWTCDAGETCDTCAQDCGACPTCGNGYCEWGEACDTCSQDCGTCPTCGDGTCQWPETCDTCASDCNACPVCGDGTCDSSEWCSTCSQDCGACAACGDGTCDPGESCASCSSDCGACACHDKCETGTPMDGSCGQCEGQICAADPFCCQGMWDSLCVSEAATICNDPCPVVCGNWTCEAGETCDTCSQDCGACPTCGNGFCEWGEACDTCSQDCGACPVCGDGTCDWPEACDTCASDCGACAVCGDGTCDPSEWCSTCASDCGACPTCGDGTCDPFESCSTCASDCGACVCHDKCVEGAALDWSCGQCESQVCAVDYFCCQNNWDSLCVSHVSSVCGETCP